VREVEAVSCLDLEHRPGEPGEELGAPRGQSESFGLLALSHVQAGAQRMVDGGSHVRAQM
jgi:hypothetical protein